MTIIIADIWAEVADLLYTIMYDIISLLPPSPFVILDNSPVSEYIPFMNWVIPFDYMVGVLTAWLGAVTVYYVWSVLLRWVKAIN